MTNRADGIKPPKRSELTKKHAAIKALRDRSMTNASRRPYFTDLQEEVERQIQARRQANTTAQRGKNAIEVSSLVAARNLALRRNDTKEVQRIDSDIVNLGGDPNTGEMLDERPSGPSEEDYDAKIQRINENNKRKTREAMMAANQASLARKRAQDAIVRANR